MNYIVKGTYLSGESFTEKVDSIYKLEVLLNTLQEQTNSDWFNDDSLVNLDSVTISTLNDNHSQ